MIRLLAALVPVLSLVVVTGAARADEAWPAAGINTLRTVCYSQPRPDVPAAYLAAYCTCYVALVPTNVPWNDWFLVDLAIKTKGIQNLDASEKHTMVQALLDATYCLQKHVPQ